MLDAFPAIATIAVRDLARSRAWYAATLGVTPVQEPPGALVYRTGGSSWLLFEDPSARPVAHQVAAWTVDDLVGLVGELRERGVELEEYPELTSENGIATTPVGHAAWFRDPDGNLLTLMQLD